jgi:hypothetical protein
LGYFLQKDGWNAKTEKKEAVGQKKVKNRERGIGHIWGKNPEVTLRMRTTAMLFCSLFAPCTGHFILFLENSGQN